jgi:bifunctional UDP-N-acetylglucosamine pyrophosphorylase/glucosamine-1-phosphate N-acetyltransferase
MEVRSAVILAAGKGTRMKSSIPKVMHKILGKSMIMHVIDNLKASGVDKIVVVLGHEAALVRTHLQDVDKLTFVEQQEQLGTAHALLQAEAALAHTPGVTMVAYGDVPLFSSTSFARVFDVHEATGAEATIVSGILDDATGYGRIIRDVATSHVLGNVEEKDATTEQKKIREFNAGTYCFNNASMFTILHQITNDNAQHEYYLPDAIGLYVQAGARVEGYLIDDVREVMGVNDRVALAEVEGVLSRKINHQWQIEGVSIMQPNNTYIGTDVVLAADVVVEPNTTIFGKSTVKSGAHIGSNSEIVDSYIGENTVIRQSVITDSHIGRDNTIGPFAHIRAGAVTGEGNRLGNFIEVKKSKLGAQTKAAHLTYIGDSEVGARVNFGCGSITVNYNGVSKSKTSIGDDVFIGCNANLLAPVTIGNQAVIAAGTTVDKDVPAEDLAIGRSRQENKHGYGVKIKERYKNEKK